MSRRDVYRALRNPITPSVVAARDEIRHVFGTSVDFAPGTAGAAIEAIIRQYYEIRIEWSRALLYGQHLT